MPPLYTLDNVAQIYAGRTVLSIPHLAIPAGQSLAIVGPSGAGKSTLLRLLAFLEEPTEGQIAWRGETTISAETRRSVTMVFQRPALLRRTVRDNILYGLKIRGETAGQHLETLSEQLGIAPLLDTAAHKLSGGEQQRVALARALITRPAVLLLDEPTAHLDPQNVRLIETMINDSHTTTNTTIVWVTHNLFQAQRVAAQTALLLDGRLIEIAPTDAFFARPQQPETAAFLKGTLIY